MVVTILRFPQSCSRCYEVVYLRNTHTTAVLRWSSNVSCFPIQAGLWSGDLVLRDLEVRTDVSRKLHLPIVLKQGSVELVRIQVRTVSQGNVGIHCGAYGTR